MMGWNTGWGVGNWIGMDLGTFVFWGLVIFGLVVLLRPSNRESRRDPEPAQPEVPEAPTALRTLDERFARGELSEQDYRQRRDLILGR